MSVRTLYRKLPHRDSSINWTPYYYVLPLVVVYLGLLTAPILFALGISFVEFTTINQFEWVGLENYVTVWSDPQFWNALKNTVFFSFGTAFIPMAIGLGLAMILQKEFVGNITIRSLIFVPFVVPAIVVGLLFQWMFTQFGIVNAGVVQLGLVDSAIRWLSSGQHAIATVVGMGAWRTVGFNMIIFLAGLQSIPDQLYEAAEIQGKSRWATFRHITLPLLKPSIIIAAVLGVLRAIKGFAEIWVMTEGGPGFATETIGVYFYRVVFIDGSFGEGAAVGFFMLILGLIFSFGVLKVR